MAVKQETRIVTGEARLSYVNVFKPYAHMEGQEEKYSVTILIPKTDVATKARIDAAINAAIEQGINTKWNGVKPPKVAIPVYDGDGTKPSDGTEFGPECKGHWVFTATSKKDNPPQVVDAQVQPILNQSEIYSGIYGRVSVVFAPYMYGGKKELGFILVTFKKQEMGNH